MEGNKSRLWQWVFAVLLSIPIVVAGIVAVWFGIKVFIFGITEAPYTNTAERIFNICFGGVVLSGSVLVPLRLLYSTFKKPLKSLKENAEPRKTSGGENTH